MRRLYYLTDSEELARQVARQLHSIQDCVHWRFQAFTYDGGGHYRLLLTAPATQSAIALLDRWMAWLYLRLQMQRQRFQATSAKGSKQRIVLVVFVRKQDEQQIRNVMSHLPICALGLAVRRSFKAVLGRRVVQA